MERSGNMGSAVNFAKRSIEFVKELILAVLMALLFTTFIVSHNKIPTPSMVSTINVNDHILTAMVPYYYRDPNYGEIVVFKNGEDSWVKRVIGLPGDVIDIREGNVYVNDVKIDESAYLASEGISDPYAGSDHVSFPYTVPEDSYFLMGDNRTQSQDSRYIGAVSRDRIYGKAWIKIYPFNQIGPLK